MTTLELFLPLPNFFGGYLGNPETVREGDTSSGRLTQGDVCRDHTLSLFPRPPRQNLAPAVHDLGFTEIRRREWSRLARP